jgi:hypothetical protein
LEAVIVFEIASQDYLKKLLDEKFETFTFSPVGVSVYQLGNLGAAQGKLKSCEFKM